VSTGADRARRTGLFLFGAASGLPQVAYSLGPVRVRVDDGLLVLMAFMLLFQRPRPAEPKSARLLMTGLFCIYVLYCLVSCLWVAVTGASVMLYWIALLLGGTLIYLVLFSLLRSSRDLAAICAGLTVCTVTVAVQLYWNIVASGGLALSQFAATIYDVKGELSPTTWNPNNIGHIGVLTFFSAIIAGHLRIGRGRLGRWPWALAPVSVMMPLALINRGSILALGAGIAFLLLLVARRHLVLLISSAAAAGLIVFEVLRVTGRVGLQAMQVNLASGEGTARRFVYWPYAIAQILERPLLGWGYSRDGAIFRRHFNMGSTHNSLLNVLLETGVVGLVLLLGAAAALIAYYREAYRTPGTDRALLNAGVALLLAIFLSGMTAAFFPWQKLAVIAVIITAAIPQVVLREAAARTD
jgi:O-antigen ligase